MSVKILHNPRCSKSRATLALLQEHGVQPEVELYQSQHYSPEAIRAIAEKLGVEDLREMMRTKDELYRTLELAQASQEQLLQAIVANPQLLERPIVIKGDKACIGRPPENVLAIL
ncbi:arsenate reductase (glutaredoxin) [Pasteurellaceae bacterium HPA106]|uniref:arsenate reductase (glutaredoxin) n=1 Tax=Spirabiliibacterium pneumoniae TaxID=221400 RepID=UPI001AACB55E|nr:arsenate reductase (glutaredoxin) [Spirabiliibacterium pneumoniae]MBE2895877.1 arsenate reductase (glutaredoxin) [Spirabiliibacterium pneumoniae]